jgi:RNA polymerase subunit RPABC4/transcription elongation factor Spt4
MRSFTHYLWNEAKIGLPPAKQNILLGYDSPENILMTFAIDFTTARTNTYLDPAQPIRINGRILEIPALPENPLKLRVVEKENLDVTKYVKSAPPGMNNEIEVNYIVKGLARALFSGHVGNLTLYLVVNLPEAKKEVITIEKQVVGPTKFCMSCQYSMPADANFCPSCGVSPQAFSGQETKACVNCKETVPARAKFCPKCGASQPP